MFKYKRKLKLFYEYNIQYRNVQSNQPKTLDVLFFGTDKFSLPSLKALVNEQWVLLLVMIWILSVVNNKFLVNYVGMLGS